MPDDAGRRRGGWDAIYREVIARGVDDDAQRRQSGWLEPALDLVGPAAGRRALDLGCGLGGDLARLADDGWRAEGLDGEPLAARHVRERYGLPVRVADLADPLPWGDERFHLVVSRLALHALPPDPARRAFAEIRRVLAPGGVLAFMVNAEGHLRRRLQYDYRGARRVAPHTWYLPSLDRTYLFYTPERARRLLGGGWHVHRCDTADLDHWGILKHVLVCVAQRGA